MPKISTHLHLALKLCDRISIENKIQFMLGSAYPDCMDAGYDEFLSLHYKESRYDTCNLEKFCDTEEKNDFNLGYYFHLWADNRIAKTDTGDISKYDCMICDTAVIAPVVQELKKYDYAGKECTAMKNIMSLESEPVPLYLVAEEKRRRYESILDGLADGFIRECSWTEWQIKPE